MTTSLPDPTVSTEARQSFDNASTQRGVGLPADKSAGSHDKSGTSGVEHSALDRANKSFRSNPAITRPIQSASFITRPIPVAFAITRPQQGNPLAAQDIHGEAPLRMMKMVSDTIFRRVSMSQNSLPLKMVSDTIFRGSTQEMPLATAQENGVRHHFSEESPMSQGLATASKNGVGHHFSEKMRAKPVLGEGSKEGRRKWLKFALRAGITLLLLFFLVRSFSWSTLLATLMHANQMALGMGLAVGMLCILFSAYTWRSLVLGEGIPIDLSKLINLYFVGLAFSHFLPTSVGGDAVKAFYVGRESGNIAGATSSVMMSRIAGFLGMLLIALPTLLFWHAQFTSSLVTGFLLLSLLLVAMIGGAFFFSAHLATLSTRFLKAAWLKHRLVATVIKVGDALSAAFRRPQALGAAILFAMLFWVASFFNYYGYAEALGLHLPLYFYVIAISFTSIVAFLPISINGFGVREWAMVYVFSTIHIAPGTSLLLALLMDAQVLLFGIVGGFIYFTMSNKKGVS